MASLGTIYAELALSLDKFDVSLREAESKLKNAEKQFEGFAKIGKRLSSVGADLTKFVTLPIVGIGVAAIKASTDIESAFAGVRKTVDATETELAELKEGFTELARRIPLATTEIYGIGEAAGQLGIKTQNILGFAEVMAKLGMTTNLSSQDAATALARLANITQMPQTQFDRLGATVVALGNNLATTEREIVEMGLNLAGAGKQVGFSEAQILAFAGALSSVGIEAQMGGTAISRVMSSMQLAVETGNKQLRDFAEVAGMTSEQFVKAFREDAASAIITFIEGLGAAKEEGTTAIKVLDDMGITETRLRDALTRAAGAGDLFRQSIELGNKAWKENAALNKEAEQRIETTGAQFQLLVNDLKQLAAAFGDIVTPALRNLLDKYIRPAIKWVTDLDDSTKKWFITLAGIGAFVGPAIWLVGQLFGAVASINAGLAAMGVGGAVAAAGTAAAGTAAGAATPLVAGLAGAVHFLLGPWGLLIAGVTAFIALASKLKDAEETQADRIRKMQQEAAVLAGTLDTDLCPAFRDLTDVVEDASKAMDFFEGKSTAGLGVGNQRVKSILAAFGTMEEYSEHLKKLKEDRIWNQNGAQYDPAEALSQLQARMTAELAVMDAQLEIARLRFELLALGIDPVTRAAELLTERLASQREELDLTAERIRVLTGHYESMKALKGETAAETLELEAAILRETLAFKQLEQAIADTKKELTGAQDDQIYAGTRAMILAKQNELMAAGDIMGALELQRVVMPDLEGKAQSALDRLRGSVIGMATGGVLTEPVFGLGLHSGRNYAFAEQGPERVVPMGQGGNGVGGGVKIDQVINIHGNLDRQALAALDATLDRRNADLVMRLRLAKPGVI